MLDPGGSGSASDIWPDPGLNLWCTPKNFWTRPNKRGTEPLVDCNVMAAGMTWRQSPGCVTEAWTVRFGDYWKATECNTIMLDPDQAGSKNS